MISPRSSSCSCGNKQVIATVTAVLDVVTCADFQVIQFVVLLRNLN